MADAVKQKSVTSAFSEVPDAPAPGRWATIVAQHPCKVIWSTLVFALIGIVLGAVIPDQPDFGKAKIGFEPRGTDFAIKLNAMRQLHAYPKHRRCGDCDEEDLVDKRRLKDRLAGPQTQSPRSNREQSPISSASSRHLEASRECSVDQVRSANNSNLFSNPTFQNAMDQWTSCYSWERGLDNLFCRGGPFQKREYAPMVILEEASGEEGDIGSLSKLHDVCALSRKLKSSGAYQDHGRSHNNGKCGLYSLPETLMLLDVMMQIDFTHGTLVSGSSNLQALEATLTQIISGTISCTHLTQEMLDRVLQRASRCGTALFDGTCTRGATRPTSTNFADLSCKPSANDPTLLQECNPFVNLLVNFVYTYLVDDKYMDPEAPASARSKKLTYTSIVTPVYDEAEYYEPLIDEFGDYRSNDESLRIAGIKLDDKGSIFDKALTSSVIYVMGSVMISFTFLVIHTRGLTFSVMVLIQVYISMGFAYFLQRVVLPFEFFPFLNLTMAFVAIAIGVDDVFVFMDAYRQSFLILPPNTELASRLQWVFSRSFSAMLVTTLTTSVAFLANIVSPITTIKSFGIFSSLVVSVDFVFMMSVLPSMLVVVDYTSYRKLCTCGTLNKALPDRAEEANQRGERMKSHRFEMFYRRYVSKAVTHLVGKWVLALMGTGLGIFFVIQALGLKKSDAESLQLFKDGHPTEDYDQKLFRYFRFEPESKSSGLPVKLVSGVVPSDTGNYFDPFNFGPLEWGSGDLNSKEAQTWFANLCDSFSTAPLFKNLETCAYHYLREFVARTDRCNAPSTPCCGLTFPIERDQIPVCLNAMEWYARVFDGSILRDDSGYIKVVSVGYLTTQAYTSNFDKLEDFYNAVKGWAESQVSSAPSSIPPPFWFSELEFWDLQNSLNSGAYIGAGVALICCTIVLLLVVGNILMALYALISIVWILAAVVATLRLFGFVLDLMVAIVMAISIGMSVDFVCHMAHAYVRHGANKSLDSSYIDQLPWKSHEERSTRAKDSLSSMGISVTLGAMTTFFGGLVMLLTSVKFFYQFGIFLATTMFWSLLFAVVYFPALAACIGPVGFFGDLWPVVQFFKDKCSSSSAKGKSSADTPKDSADTPKEEENTVRGRVEL